MRLRASSLAAVLLAAVLLAGVLTTPPARASAAAGVARAQARLDSLAAQIRVQAAALTQAQEARVVAARAVSLATSRLALLQGMRAGLDAQVAEAQSRADALQRQLNEVVAAAYMGSGGQGSGLAAAVLGARSFQEVGDRIVFAGASGDAAVKVAQELARARADLDARRGLVGALAAGQLAVVARVTDAADASARALAAEQAASDALAASRERVLALVRDLRERDGGMGPVDLGEIVGALQGADSVTYGRWAALLLRSLEAPVCRNSLVVVVSWQVAESTQAAWNPLATTHRMEGSTDFNSVGVQNFVSLAQGLAATRETLEFGWNVYGYGDIVRSLRACAPAMVTARAVNASSWCPGCVDGRYVLNIVPRVEADLESYLGL